MHDLVAKNHETAEQPIQRFACMSIPECGFKTFDFVFHCISERRTLTLPILDIEVLVLCQVSDSTLDVSHLDPVLQRRRSGLDVTEGRHKLSKVLVVISCGPCSVIVAPIERIERDP